MQTYPLKWKSDKRRNDRKQAGAIVCIGGRYKKKVTNKYTTNL